MAWKKGESGNLKGRPPKGDAFMEKLQEAIKNVEKATGIQLMEHLVLRAMENDQVLIALTKKLVPDLRQVDSKVDGTLEGSLTISWVTKND